MNEEQAYDKLQELLTLAEQIRDSGFYAKEDIVSEIENRLF